MRLLLVLIGKILRDQRATLAFTTLVGGIFFGLGSYLFVTFGEMNMEAMGKLSPQLIQGFFGGMFGAMTPLETWLATLFVHPLVLAMFAISVVSIASKSLAGEIDRGTVDLLLSCPVARWQPVLATVLTVLGAIATLTVVIWWGMRVGFVAGDIELPESLPAIRYVALNLFALYFGVAGVCVLISATSSQQGVAIGRSLGFIVLSFFVNVLASLWSRAQVLDTFSVFHYMRPQPTIQNLAPPTSDLMVLFGLGFLGFALAFVAFVRRDISTV